MPGNFPQVYANINFPPQIVVNQAQADGLGGAWQRLDFTPYLQHLPGLCPVTLSPMSITHPKTADTGTFTVTVTATGINNTWTANVEGNNPWITITSPTTPQVGNGSVSYSVTANFFGPGRTANINVNNQHFAVIQQKS